MPSRDTAAKTAAMDEARFKAKFAALIRSVPGVLFPGLAVEDCLRIVEQHGRSLALSPGQRSLRKQWAEEVAEEFLSEQKVKCPTFSRGGI